jgi:hypothetical protein
MTTIETAENEYRTAIQNLIAKYGNATNVPPEEMREPSEIIRLRYTMQKYEGKVTAETLSKYMFPPSIIAKVNPEFDGLEPKVKRVDKYDEIYKWLDDNAEATVTTQFLTELSEMSYPTILKFIDSNPQYFKKIKKGLYQVRNPKEERKAEK